MRQAHRTRVSATVARVALRAALGGGVALIAAFACQAAEIGPVHVFEKVEITLTATQQFSNPYTGVDVWVDLEGPDFKKRCPGFWDGGQTFRVRITALAPGTWRWVSGSNPPDSGLGGKRGSFTAVAWSAAEKQENPNRRGFPRATPNGHALQYADGTPYFILGDFVYPASTWRYRWRESDQAFPVDTPEAGFKDIVKFRKAQEFNMLYIISSFPSWANDGHPREFKDKAGVPLRSAWQRGDEDRAEEMQNEDGERPFFFPGKAVGYPDVCPDYTLINPSWFRYLDKKIDYANAQGMQVFLETLRRDIGPYLKAYYGATSTDMSQNAVFHYIRYIFARYQANAVFFGIIHQDRPVAPDHPYSLVPGDWRIALDGYHARYGRPPFGQMVTTNPTSSTYAIWGHTDKSPWLTMHQVGNSPRDHTSSELVLEMYKLPNPIPAYNQEPWYISDDSPHERARNRSTMYSCLLSGGLAGVAYQAKGMCRGNRENSSSWPNMWVSVKWQSANEVRHAKTFLMTHGARYRDLVPRRELLSSFKSGKSGWKGWSYCLRTDDRKLFKLYCEAEAPRSVLSGAVPNAAYQARWFDPRTGKSSSAGDGNLKSDGRGMIAIPQVPSANEDWALTLSLEGSQSDR